jgi:hypothetical protein
MPEPARPRDRAERQFCTRRESPNAPKRRREGARRFGQAGALGGGLLPALCSTEPVVNRIARQRRLDCSAVRQIWRAPRRAAISCMERGNPSGLVFTRGASLCRTPNIGQQVVGATGCCSVGEVDLCIGGRSEVGPFVPWVSGTTQSVARSIRNHAAPSGA